jgi:SpoIIAA-like
MTLAPLSQTHAQGIMTTQQSGPTTTVDRFIPQTIDLGANMIEYDLDAAHNILSVRPHSALDKKDFEELAKAVDPQIEATGELGGLIIDARAFPGWDSFGAMLTHFRFLRDHQKHINKVAVVTDSHLGDVAEHLASHFVSATIRHFPAGHVEEARRWIINGS